MLTIEQIRALIQAGQYVVHGHLITELDKEGIPVEEATIIILNGKIIEEYPERQRVLVAGLTSDQVPAHIVCDLSMEDVVQLVTGYIPDSRQWFGTKKRKPKRRGNA